jgi:hypothetical protein
MKPVFKYTAYCGMTYGLVRKAIQMKTATITVYDKNTHEKRQAPVLLTDKVLVTIVHACAGAYLWPWYLYMDTTRAEMRLRQLDPYYYTLFDNKMSPFDYLYC